MSSKTFAGKHLSAEHLVKTSLYYREAYQRKFVKAFQHLQSSVLASLSKASELTTGDPSKIQGILCGESLHTSNTELFFPEVCYHDNAFDEQKTVMYHKFPSYTTDAHKTRFATWKCSNLCNTTASHIPSNLMDIYSKIGECLPLMARRYVQQIDECNKRVIHDANLQGHSKDCYLDPQACGSPLLFLRCLAPHYPAIRKLVNMLYEVRRADAKISVLDRALYRGDVSALQNIVKEQKETRKLYMLGDDILDKSIILKEYDIAFTLYNKKCLEHAEFPCLSCNKLCFKQECVQLDKCRREINNKAWDQLLTYLKDHPAPEDGLPKGYM